MSSAIYVKIIFSFLCVGEQDAFIQERQEYWTVVLKSATVALSTGIKDLLQESLLE